MQFITDTWGEVWSEPSDPISVTIRELTAPTNTKCKIDRNIGSTSCSVSPNQEVDETLIEFLDFNGDVISSKRVSNRAEQNQQLQTVTSSFLFSASFVRVSGITGKPTEWMRRGESVTVKVRSQARGTLYVTL
jgi:hypothetical protein